MLSAEDRGIARVLGRRLTEVTAVLDLLVFGSRARGDAAADADLDVFVELESVTPALRRRITDIAWEVGFDLGRVITTVVASRQDIEVGRFGGSPLLLAIQRDGVRP